MTAVGAPARSRRSRPVSAAPSRGNNYMLLVTVITVLCLVGLVMVLSASSVTSLREFGDPWRYFERQGMYLCMGAIAFFAAQGTRMEFWQRYARLLLVLSVVALMAVLVVGRSAGGAARWLGSGSLQFQPSELAKLALVLFAADVLARREGKRDWVYRAAPVLMVTVLFGGLIMKQPDMGTTVVVCCIGAAVLFAAGMPVRPMLGLGLAAGVVGAAYASTASYRASRVMSFIDPFANARTSGYQSVQSIIALGGGHWTGTGIGQSMASWGYLPNQYTDFIFAVIGQETGFAGSVVVIALFGALAVIGSRVAWRAPSTFDSLVAAGVTAWLVSQAVINIGAVAGALPVTGVPLPFISYGGTSLVIVLFATGLLANVARRCPASTTSPAAPAARAARAR